jgi:hypothetical protein
MKKFGLIAFGFIAVCLMSLCLFGLLGCDFFPGTGSPEEERGAATGLLSLRVEGGGADAGRAITSGADLPASVLAGLRYELVLTGPGGESLGAALSDGGETVKLTVALGEWRIDARAYQGEVLAGTGSVVFTVVPGLNSVWIPMRIAGGYFEIVPDPGISGGKLESNFAGAFPGTLISLTLRPDPGFVLKAGTVKYSYGGNDYTPEGSGSSYSFTMPAADVKVRAEFTAFTRYVTASGTGDGLFWATASGDLQLMMDELAELRAAGYTDPLIVKLGAGTYLPQYAPAPDGSRTTDFGTYGLTDRDSTFILREGVELRGGYLAAGEDIDEGTRKARFDSRGLVTSPLYQAVLSGDIGTPNLDTDNTYHVVLGVNIPADSGTVLDGLTISGGYGTGVSGTITVDGETIHRINGGGISNYSSSPVLTNMAITRNSASSNGSGGGIFTDSSSPVLANVTISGNSGGVNGGGMFNYNSSSPVLANVTISGNSAVAGGGIFNDSSSPVLTSVTISGNSGGNGGGGIFNHSSSPVLANVTISGNSGGVNGGGMCNSSVSSPVVRNSLVWGNISPGIYNNGGSTSSFAYSLVQGSGGASWNNSAGTEEAGAIGSNLDTDPLFRDWQNPGTVTMPNTLGDYRPQDGSGGAGEGTTQSPAIDGGDNSRYPADADDPIFSAITLSETAKALINEALQKDLAGNTRIQGGSIDMGAYERR